MKLGISTSSLYPMPTEQALSLLVEQNVETVEIFFNAFCELEPDFLTQLKEILRRGDTQVLSVHPFTCTMEPMLFFGDYDRRFDDGIAMYRKYFAAAETLGAKYLVLHGDRGGSLLPQEEHFERFSRLAVIGREYGVTLAQENVARCRSGRLDFLLEMKRALGEDAAFVLDLKQARRANEDATHMLTSLGDSVKHIHISDGDAQHDCQNIGAGATDFAAFFSTLRRMNYDGGVLLELYRHNYGDISEFFDGYRALTAHR